MSIAELFLYQAASQNYAWNMLTLISPYAILSILSALITFAAAIAAWRRSAPGSFALSLLLLSMAVWSGGYATRWLGFSVETKIFFFRSMYIGVALIPTLFLVFALAFTRQESWLTPRRLVLLFLQPLLSILFQWTNLYHGLLYTSLKVIQENDVVLFELTRGPWYLLNIIYSYAAIGAGVTLLGLGTMRSGPLYRHQYRLILIGSILPWVGSIINEFRFKPSDLDFPPLTFGLSGIIFAIAVVRTHLMDLIPVARSHLIETMGDGILVLDAQHRIVDVNPAMEKFIAGKASSYMGKHALDVLQPWLESTDIFLDLSEKTVEMQIPIDPARYLDLRVTPLYDHYETVSGRLMVFRDITERKQVEKRLRYVNDKLQGQLIEIGLLQSKLREQAIRDPLTNLFNRRYLEETLERELSRAGRESYPVCVIMIDLDHFKRINDTYGHEAGDRVLQAVANVFSEQSRRGDFACRYGGEEFFIAMPNITMPVAYERAEMLRQALTSLRVSYEVYELSVTISMGIACYPENGQTRETLLRAADRAMYAAKEAGRDHILAYDQIRLPADALDKP